MITKQLDWLVSLTGVAVVLLSGVPLFARQKGQWVPGQSAHPPGFQTNFIAPTHGLSLFFKYFGEASARDHSQGRTVSCGGTWTLKIPKT